MIKYSPKRINELSERVYKVFHLVEPFDIDYQAEDVKPTLTGDPFAIIDYLLDIIEESEAIL